MDGGTWGGSEELWSQAAHMLKRQGHDVFVSISEWQRRADQVISLSRAGIQIQAHRAHQVSRVRRSYEKLAHGGPKEFDRLKRFRPDLVIISQGHNSGGFEWAKVCRAMSTPYIMIVHCNSEYWWFGDQLSDAIETYTAAQHTFCVSQANLNLLRLQLGDSLPSAEVVRNPFNVTTGDVPAWPDESHGYRMACVARLGLAAKGQDILLQVLARPEWRDRPVELNLFGAGPDEPVIRQMIKTLKLEHVNLRGQVGDIQAVWAENHLLVLPSRFEGLPLTLVEAMWCGRPAVVTDVGGNAELCADGETGFVASAPTVLSFADALQRGWDRRREWSRIGLAARSRVESLVPADPVLLFCERLKECIVRKNEPKPPARELIAH